MKKIIMMICAFFIFYLNGMNRINENNGVHGLKILHLGFQLGCIRDFEDVAKELKLDVTSWYLLSDAFAKDFFDGCACGNQIYNISSERARNIWQLHKDFFNQFDVIVTSDTAPLMRIFLENGWQKPLIVWICNRFDYYHGPSECNFPDQAYYDLVNTTINRKNVYMISYTDYEWVYAQSRGVNFGNTVIKPIGSIENEIRDGTYKSGIPASVDKKNSLFIYPRFDTSEQIDFIQQSCNRIGIKTYYGAYNEPDDLAGFKGVVYFPYQWSNIALFENIQRGIIHFVPTVRFLKQLVSQRYPIRENTQGLINGPYQYCEWYQSTLSDLFVYFDSWQDLQDKVHNTDYVSLSQHIQKRAIQLRNNGISAWHNVFKEIVAYINKGEKI